MLLLLRFLLMRTRWRVCGVRLLMLMLLLWWWCLWMRRAWMKGGHAFVL